MSTERDEIVQTLNSILQITSYRDYCPNGMQVVGKSQVEKVALAVSANLESIQLAAANEADLLLVHHGLFWENMPREIGPLMKGRLQVLFQYDISLLAYHLPLDAHEEIGNNSLWLQQLGFTENMQPFANVRGKDIGHLGEASEGPIDFAQLVADIEVGAEGTVIAAYQYGKKQVKRVGVVTGGGYHNFTDALELGCDTFLTGEAGEPTEAIARELGANFIAMGHYNSEKIGVLALGDILRERFGVETVFCGVPNPV